MHLSNKMNLHWSHSTCTGRYPSVATVEQILKEKNQSNDEPCLCPLLGIRHFVRLQTEEGENEEERGQEWDDEKTSTARKDGHHHGYIVFGDGA